MQAYRIAILALACGAPAAALRAGHRDKVAKQMGPSGCVSLTRSSSGSCIFTTRCRGVDIDTFEFNLDCWNPPDDTVRHTFGYGGFDAEEEFDTEVQCQRCEVPAPEGAEKQSSEAAAAGRTNGQAKAVPVLKPLSGQGVVSADVAVGRSVVPAARGAVSDIAERFGPGNCVATWKDANSGHCMMQTQCEAQDMTNFEYEFLCIDSSGSPMRHQFGKGSFDPKETFNTLIACDKCLAPNASLAAVGSSSEVGALRQEIADLKNQTQQQNAQIMQYITKLASAVDKINKTVFPNGAPAAAAAAASLVHVKHDQHTANLRKHHGRRHRHRSGHRHGHHHRDAHAHAQVQQEVSPPKPVVQDEEQQEAPQPTTIAQDAPVATNEAQKEALLATQDAQGPRAGVDESEMSPEEEEELPRYGSQGPSQYGAPSDD